MILPRFLAIACCFLLLQPGAFGQHSETRSEVLRYSGEQIVAVDSVRADSTGKVLEVPNVFTPNGDGKHDYIEVVTDGTTIYDFSIFMRTGTQVYHTHSPRIFWDGTSSVGIDLKEGVYYYVIEETGSSEPFSGTGIIYLFR